MRKTSSQALFNQWVTGSGKVITLWLMKNTFDQFNPNDHCQSRLKRIAEPLPSDKYEIVLVRSVLDMSWLGSFPNNLGGTAEKSLSSQA